MKPKQSPRHFHLVLMVLAMNFGARCIAQTLPVDSITSRITYSEVVQVDSVSADELFNRATIWFTNQFKNTSKAIEFSDRASGVLVSSPDVNFPAYYVRKNGERLENGVITFQLKVQCKDGRYKYTLTNLVHSGTSCNGGELERESTICLWRNLWESLKLEANSSCAHLIQDLMKSMASRKVTDGGDW